MNMRYMLISAAIAGTLTALLSSLPVVSLLNCLLCAWLWAGGIFAVFLYRSTSGEGLAQNQTMILGLVTGIFGAIVATVLNAIGSGAATPISAETMQQLEEMLGESAQVVTQFASSGASVAISFVMNIIIYPLFGLLGGLIASRLFKDPPQETGPLT